MDVVKSAKNIVKDLKKGVLVTDYKLNGRIYKLESYVDGVFYIEIDYSSEDIDLELRINKSDWSYETKILSCPE